MGRSRKYRLPAPPPLAGVPSPPSIVELEPQGGRAPVPVVYPLPGGPAPAVLVLHPRGPKLDPNRPLVPTPDEVAALPRWAKMAFAARCARRVLPLLTSDPVLAGSECHRWTADLVSAAEQSAAVGALQTRPLATASRALRTHQGAASGLSSWSVAAAQAAARALGCEAAQAAVAALQQLATMRTLRFVRLPRRDFDDLLRVSRQQNWGDETPVAPETFGPMWDRDPPVWWGSGEPAREVGSRE